MDSSPTPAADYAIFRGDVAAALLDVQRAEGIAQRRYALDRLERALRRADPGSVPAHLHDELGAAGVGPESLAFLDAPSPPHGVLVALLHVDGTAFCRLMYVDYLRSRGAPSLDDEARLAVEDAVALAARQTGRLVERGYRLIPFVDRALDDARVQGTSLAAAAFVSAVSRFSGRPVRAGTMVTGALTGERLARVGGLAAKVRAAASRADVRRVVVPSAEADAARAARDGAGRTQADLPVIGVATLAALLETSLEEVAPHRDFDAEVRAARRSYGEAWQGYKWPVLVEPMARLAADVPVTRPDLRIRALSMYGAVLRALGALEHSEDVLERALAVLDEPLAEIAVPDAERCALHRHVAMTERARGRHEPASRAASLAVESARRGRDRKELISSLGVCGLVALLGGDAEAAVRWQRASLAHAVEHDPKMAPRAASYVVQALGEAGRPSEALAVFEEALDSLRRLGRSPRTSTDETWLRVNAAGAVLASDPARAVELLSAPLTRDAMRELPLPGLLIRRYFGLAEVRTGRAEEGFARLGASPTAYGRIWNAQVRTVALSNVLFEADARADVGGLDRDARARARRALDELEGLSADPDGAPLFDAARREVSGDVAARGALTGLLQTVVRRV